MKESKFIKYQLNKIPRDTWGKFKQVVKEREEMTVAERLRDFVVQYVDRYYKDSPAPIVKPVKAGRVYPTPAPKPATVEPEYSENLDDI